MVLVALMSSGRTTPVTRSSRISKFTRTSWRPWMTRFPLGKTWVMIAATVSVSSSVRATEPVPVLDEVLPRLRTLAGETADKLTEIATRIYEASSFQDITGQRITKVLKVLGTIEGKVGQMAVAIGYEADPNAPPSPEESPDSEDSLLNGPSMPEVANTQADIDALFD